MNQETKAPELLVSAEVSDTSRNLSTASTPPSNTSNLSATSNTSTPSNSNPNHSVRGENHHHPHVEEIRVLRSHKSPARTFTSGVLFGDVVSTSKKSSRDRSNSIGHTARHNFSRSNSTHNTFDNSLAKEKTKSSVFGTLTRSRNKTPTILLLRPDSETSPITRKLSRHGLQYDSENTTKRDQGEGNDDTPPSLNASLELDTRLGNGAEDPNTQDAGGGMRSQTELLILQQLYTEMGKTLINVFFPDKSISKVELIPNKTVKDLLQNQISLHRYEFEGIVAKDGNGTVLDWYAKVEDLNLMPSLEIKLFESSPLVIYLPNSIKKVPWDMNANKDLRTILQAYVYEAKPEYQSLVPSSWLNPDEKYNDLNIKLHTLPDRSLCIGTDRTKWSFDPRKIKTKKPTKTNSQISRVRTSLTKSKVPLSSDTSNSLTRRLAASYFYVYLPDGSHKTYSFEHYKETELGELLEQLLKNRGNLDIKGLYDLEGRELDLKKKLKDLGVLEVTCIPIKSWIALAAADAIAEYLKPEVTIDTAMALKVYLPQGIDSQFLWKEVTTSKLSQVLSKVRIKRADLNLNEAIAQDLQGRELDINKTIEELDKKQIFYGVSVVDWILYVEKEKNDNESLDKMDKKQLIDYFMSLDKIITGRGENNKMSGLKSPPRKTKEIAKSSAQISISEQLQNLKLNDPIQLNSQLTAQVSSFWHIQHFYLEDEKHFEHYAELEGQFKYTYMVPFPFLDYAPARKKPWEKFSENSLAASSSAANDAQDSSKTAGPPEHSVSSENNETFDEFLNQMEGKMKRIKLQ